MHILRRRLSIDGVGVCDLNSGVNLDRFAAARVDENAAAKLSVGDAVAGGAEVQHLSRLSASACPLHSAPFRTHLDVCVIIPLHRRDAPPLIEPHLPNSTQIRQQIPHALASLDIPHL